jgi:hypothetical protein
MQSDHSRSSRAFEVPRLSDKDFVKSPAVRDADVMRLVVIESPFAGDVAANVAYAKRAVHDCLMRAEAYAVEMSEADHVALLEVALASRAKILISGYHSPLYDEMLGGWLRREKKARSQGNRARTEVLWINPAAAAAWRADQPLWSRDG